MPVFFALTRTKFVRVRAKSALATTLFTLGACSTEQVPKAFWVPERSFYPFKINNHLLFLTQDSFNQRLTFQPLTKNRSSTAHWIDKDSVFSSFHYALTPYSFKNLVVFSLNKKLACFDVGTKELVWLINNKHPYSKDLSGSADTLVSSYLNEDGDGIVELRNISDGQLLSTMEYPSKAAANRVFRTPQFVQNSPFKGLVGSVIDHKSHQETEAFILTWNFENVLTPQETRVYHPNNMGFGVTQQGLEFQGDFIFLCVDRLVRFDPITSKIIWETQLPGALITSQPFFDSLLFLPLENEKLIIIEPENADLLSEFQIKGFPSRLQSAKNHLLYVSGSDGKCYKIDRLSRISRSIDTFVPPAPYNRQLFFDSNLLALRKQDSLHLQWGFFSNE